jgi:uncharacterized protein (DUF486 family)
MCNKAKQFLVGDNPFHGISHLSQRRARLRLNEESDFDFKIASRLVKTSLENGADGFLFSVSDTTLSILKNLDKEEPADLYAIVPYAYEYVRMATGVGGISGLAKIIGRRVVFSKNVTAVAPNILGLVRANPSAFLNIYLIYEMSRIKASAGKAARLKSVLLHEIITDMALALNLDWFFKSYIDFVIDHKIRPGFETRNFAYLVTKFDEWAIDFSELTLVAPFNKLGFQMNPSRIECENALRIAEESEVIAISVLAAGYLKPQEAIDYLRGLPNLSGVAVGVSKEHHAKETFRLLRESLG